MTYSSSFEKKRSKMVYMVFFKEALYIFTFMLFIVIQHKYTTLKDKIVFI